MPLVPLNEIYADANRNYYAIGQFNVSNLEFAQAVIEIAEELNAPVIVGASTSGIDYAGLQNMVAIVKTLATASSTPVALHLDHGPSIEWAVNCINAGFTSVMIDGSHLPIEENIRITREVADYAHKHNVTVEAELGRLGGIEDDIDVSSEDAFLTDPNDAQRFAEESGCDALAIAVGTSHGAHKFKDKVNLDFNRIETIKKRLEIPLVLHGASGISETIVQKLKKYGGEIDDAKGVPDEAYREAVKRGINKINIDTDLRLAFTAELRHILTEKPQLFDPRKILSATRDALREVVRDKITVFGSCGKAAGQQTEIRATHEIFSSF